MRPRLRQLVILLLLITCFAAMPGIFCVVPAAASPVPATRCHHDRSPSLPQSTHRCCASGRALTVTPVIFSLHPAMQPLALITISWTANSLRSYPFTATTSGSPPGIAILKI